MREFTKPLLLAFLLFASCQNQDSGTDEIQVDFSGELAAEYREILLADTSLELVAINPDWPTKESRMDPASLHGYSVRGRAKLMDRELRLELLQALAQGAKENNGMSAACFNPRHVIVAENDGKTCELIICFECLACQVWDGNERVGYMDISETPRATFDRIFADAGLSIAPR
ncbi:MAG: hypothetical protein COA70_08845 [Planctomycetota bacterium]|nr:MAG: hypothetical protein COA70_08845 [Planctomycetota bacterium]